MDENEHDEVVVQNKSTSPGIRCEMANCKSNSDPNIQKSYFRFPQDDYL